MKCRMRKRVWPVNNNSPDVERDAHAGQYVGIQAMRNTICERSWESGSLAYLVLKQIQAIYREEKVLSELCAEKRWKYRQVSVRTLVDNNSAKQSIRGFCIGKKNWVMIDTIRGAKSSAIIYSIAETAEANNLKPYNYFKYLLTEIPKHLDETDRIFCEDLLSW